MVFNPESIVKVVELCVQSSDQPVLYATLEIMGIPKTLVKKLVRRGKLAEVYITRRNGYRAAVATWDWVERHHPEAMRKG